LDHLPHAVGATFGLRHGIGPQEQSDELPIRCRDRRALQLVLGHVIGHLLDGHIGPERARSGSHCFLDRLIGVLVELSAPKKAEDDVIVVDGDGGVPSQGASAVAHMADAVSLNPPTTWPRSMPGLIGTPTSINRSTRVTFISPVKRSI